MINRRIFLKSLKYAAIYVLISLLITNFLVILFRLDALNFITANICAFFIPLLTGFFGTFNHLNHHEQIKQLNQKLEKLAKYDTLTDTYNRRTFMESFEIVLEKANRDRQCLAFCLLDVDHFKKINDTCGQLCGDIVLQQLARIFRDAIREEDFLCRFGGEEFCILLPGLQQEDAYRLILNLKDIIDKQQFSYNADLFKITISFGLFFKAPREAARVDDIIRKADLALYLAKNRGRDRIEVYAACNG